MTIEEFKVEIQYWENIDLVRYKTNSDMEIEALNNEIAYRIEKNIYI
jgi:hypothetical protein